MPTSLPSSMRRLCILAAALALAGCASGPWSQSSGGDAAVQRVKTVVVIFAENHSFDNLYGLFPGADGIANATPSRTRSSTTTASR